MSASAGIESPKRASVTASPVGAPVRWGILGWGAIARVAFAPALAASPSGRLVAVASERGDASAIGTQLPGVRVHAGDGAYEALLRSDGVDAVYVSVPNHRHAELTEAAADAGKHVLCEKPLSVSAQQAARVAERCAECGVVLMEAMMARFNPQHESVRQLIDAGAIGRPRLFRASFTVDLENPASDVRFLSEPGAGSLFDVGIYGIAAARWIFAAEPEQVRALRLERPGTGTDELAGILLQFSEGRLATIDCGLTLQARDVYEVVGSEGAISVSRPFASPPFVPAERSLELALMRGGEVEIEQSEDLDQYVLQLEAFHRLLIGECPQHPYPPQESIRTAEVIDACLADSGQNGSPQP